MIFPPCYIGILYLRGAFLFTPSLYREDSSFPMDRDAPMPEIQTQGVGLPGFLTRIAKKAGPKSCLYLGISSWMLEFIIKKQNIFIYIQLFLFVEYLMTHMFIQFAADICIAQLR